MAGATSIAKASGYRSPSPPGFDGFVGPWGRGSMR